MANQRSMIARPDALALGWFAQSAGAGRHPSVVAPDPPYPPFGTRPVAGALPGAAYLARRPPVRV